MYPPFGGPMPMQNSPSPPPALPQLKATLYGPGETLRSSTTALTTVQTQRPSVHQQRAISPYGNSMANNAMNNSNHSHHNAQPPLRIRDSSPYGGESMTNVHQRQPPRKQMGMGIGHQPIPPPLPYLC